MRELTDKDIKAMLQQVEIPAHRPDLPERIIAAATIETAVPPAQIKQQQGFTSWWQRTYRDHGAKIAMAASLLVAVVIFAPLGDSSSEAQPVQQVATATQAEQDRYTVNGVPLLADISLVEEPDWDMAVLQ